MKRLYIAAALFPVLVLGSLLLGWSPAWNEKPRIPTSGLFSPGIGRCVALYEGDTMIGYTINPTEDMQRANRNRDAYAISTYNAITLIAQNAKRPDLAALAVDLRMADGPDISLEQGTTMTCYCENSLWTYTSQGKRGAIYGCGGGCGSCTHCVVKMIR